MYLLKLFSSRGFVPSLVRKGTSIVLITLEEINLRIISSTNYIGGNEYTLAEHYDLTFEELYFPNNFLLQNDTDYDGPAPSYLDFIEPNDSEMMKSKKLSYYRSISLKRWNLKKELESYLGQKLFLLMQTMLFFLHECFDFQTLIQNQTEQSNLGLINPFNGPICTLGGFIYRVFKLFYLNHDDIYAVNFENGKLGKTVSRIEHQYATFLDLYYPEKNYVFQKYFPQAIPDLYSTIDETAVFINGCFYHSHMSSDCSINKNKGPQSLTREGKTYEAVNEEFNLKLRRLMEHNQNIKQVDIIWECQIKEKMKTDVDFSNFLKNSYVWSPLERLIPRKCYRGAYVDTYFLRWSKAANPEHNFFHLDVNSLYGYVSMQNKFMIGKYEVLIGRSLNRLSISNNKFYVDGVLAMGAAQVCILPPAKLMFPFLMYRAQGGQTYNTLCKLCCETHKTKCNHNEEQRALIGCYMLSELSYAMELNYTLIHVFECHVYKENSFLLTNFVKILTSLKTKHSKVWETMPVNETRQSYSDYLNNKMGLDGPLEIKPSNANYNASKRLFYKLAQNSFFGKFGQKPNQRRTVFLTDQSQIDNLISGCDKIHDIFLVNPNLCIAETERNLKKMAPNRNGNCYLSSQITAFSREFIHRHLLLLEKIPDCKIISVDCDSLMFVLPNNVPCPFQVTAAVGDFKHEVEGQILSFFSLGPKNYILTFEKDNQINVIRKISGLSLSHASDVDPQMYENFLDNYANDIFSVKNLTQKKKKINFADLSVSINNYSFLLSNNVSTKRIVMKNMADLKTLPYGYE